LSATTTLSPTSRILVEELQRLTSLLGRAAAPTDVIAAVRGDPEHPLWPLFRGLAGANDTAWTTRLAWLVSCIRLEQGLPITATTEVDDDDESKSLDEHAHRRRALAAAAEQLHDFCATHWPAIVEADGEAPAQQLLGLLEHARRR
jgi:hypothetical protein